MNYASVLSGGDWYGGGLWSGSHYLAAHSASVSEGQTDMNSNAGAEPPSPTWVNDDGTLNESAMPAYVEAADSDGGQLVNESGEPVTVPTARSTAGPPSPGTAESEMSAVPASGVKKRYFVSEQDGETEFVELSDDAFE